MIPISLTSHSPGLKRIERLRDPLGGVTVAVERRRLGWKGRVLEGGAKRGGIDRVDERVRAHQNRVDPLGRGPQRDARNPQPVRLLLQASRVGYDPARS